MPFAVTCPKCNTALNAPDSVAGRRVSCKRCGEVFVADKGAGREIAAEATLPRTPEPPPLSDDNIRDIAAKTPPRRTQEPRPRSDDTIRDDRRRRYRDDEVSRYGRRRPRRRRKSSTGRTLVFVFVGLGALLLCCGGGIGIGIYSMYAEGEPTDIQSDEGTFTATFPGTPERVVFEEPRPINGNAGKVNYVLQTWAGFYEVTVCGLDSQQVPDDGLNEQNAEVLLDRVADEINRDGTMQVIRKSAITHQGRRGIEIEIKNSTPDYSNCRMFLVNRKLYVISLTTNNRPPDRKKATDFLNSLRIHDTDEPAINRK